MKISICHIWLFWLYLQKVNTGIQLPVRFIDQVSLSFHCNILRLLKLIPFHLMVAQDLFNIYKIFSFQFHDSDGILQPRSTQNTAYKHDIIFLLNLLQLHCETTNLNAYLI